MLLEDSFPAVGEKVAAARRAVARAAREAGADDATVSAIELAVSEAVTNAVLHAYLDAPSGRVQLRAERFDDAVKVTVSDQGRGMRPRADSPGLGLGLPLIATMARSFDVALAPDGGTELCMTFDLRAEGAAQRDGHVPQQVR